eukprot:3411863-Amphidinium_carterae.1
MMTVNIWKPGGQDGELQAKIRAVVLGNMEENWAYQDVSTMVLDFPHIRTALNIASNGGWALGQQDVATTFLTHLYQRFFA